jgi:tetratricopeptide (TPR) repeat protein
LIAKGPPEIPPAVVNALIGAAADPEPMVRIAAVRALGTAADSRALAAVSAHLTDDSRLVRVSAAEALMAAGVSHLDGGRGAALANAQEEWAQSLRTFNDVAGDQTTLGWLDSARGRTADARRELNIAIGLDPAAARPHVYLGVIAAREGRFDEALQHFTAAKARDPKYPNLSRLIDEASKRAPK